LAPVAIGTETDGSIASPASVNGIVGMKPTLGLISRTGIIPIAHSQDTAGPMARTVEDAALLLAALAGADPADTATTALSPRPAIPVRLDAAALRGARIGVVRNTFFGHDAEVDRLAEAAIGVLRAQGAVVVDPVVIPTLGTFEDDEFTVLLHEFKADIPRFFEWWGPTAPLHSVADIIAFNRERAADELRHFGQELLERADAAGPLTSPAYLDARARAIKAAREDGLDAALRLHRLDAVVAPTGGPAWPLDTDAGDSGSAFVAAPSSITAVAGYPHVTVPMGTREGLPVGLSFFGGASSDSRLLHFAHAYEQATRHRRPPPLAR
jgi:amidase